MLPGAMVVGRGLVALVFLLGGANALGADLSPGEQKMLGDAVSHLAKLEANLKLAQDTAGPGDGQPPASKARLAMTRLESARSSQAQVAARLEKLPADNAEVKAVQQRFDATVAAMTSLEARLTGKSAPTPAPAAGAKLDYRQEQALKDVQFFVRDLDGKAGALEALAQQVAKATDPNAVDYRDVTRAMNTITDARRKQQNALDRFASLPPDGRGVAETKKELDDVIARIDAAEKTFAPLNDQLTKLVDPSSYPNAKADFDRLREITSMYADTNKLAQDRPGAVAVLREMPAARAEYDRILADYKPLIGQQTELGRQFEGAGKYFVQKTTEFTAAADQQKQALPGEIDRDLEEIDKMVEVAVKEQRPAYFTEGIPQRLGWVDDKAALLEVLDPAAGKTSLEKIAAMRSSLKEREGSFREAVITANVLPPDRYQGADRGDLSQLAIEAWKKVQPDAEVLAVRIPSEQWTRETLWRYENRTWRKIDRSKVQVQLAVKQDDRLAALRAINLWKDHLSGDKLSAFPLDDSPKESDPRFLLLIEKTRQP